MRHSSTGRHLCRQAAALPHFRQLLSRAVVSGDFLSLHSLNATLQSLAGGPSPENALLFYGIIRREGGFFPDDYTIPFVLKAISRLRIGRKGGEVHAESFKLGYGSTAVVQNSLIHAYFCCGLESAARRVFDLADDRSKDVISWNSVISGYLQNDLCRRSLTFFCQMVNSRTKNRVRPDRVTLVNALVACGRTESVGFGREIHRYVVVNGYGLDYYLGSSLIDMYSKCGRVEDGQKLFDGMTDRNVVCWTSMISGYTSNGRMAEAITVFREMQAEGVAADDATAACVISACAQSGALDHGKWIHRYCDSFGLSASLKVRNALIDMYSKCGAVERALDVFTDTARRDVYSWTAMVCGLAMNEQPEKAVALFSEMERSGSVEPNEVTFLGVLSACSHGGLVEAGLHYFRRMTEAYKLTPGIQHYGCLVDLLGRAKLVDVAEEFVERMPVEPDGVIWRSLLLACRMNGDVGRAEAVARRAVELEPARCGGRILLSNAYASAAKWGDAGRVRSEMRSSGIRKQPGCSYVEIDGVVHEFLVGDRSHCRWELIRDTILSLKDSMV